MISKYVKPAILYKDELKKKFYEMYYTEDMMYYTGCLRNHPLEISDNAEVDGLYELAIVEGDKLKGFISFVFDFYDRNASRFGLLSFDHNTSVIGLAINDVLNYIMKDLKAHRIEWRMIGGNPVKKHYDRFCLHHGGKIHELTDVGKDRYGNYHNDYIYEIISKEN